MPVQKYGKTFWPNEEISGVHIEFYHVPKNDVNPKGGMHKFGIRTVLNESMRTGVDWDRALEDEEYRQSFASSSLMMHVDAMEKSLAMHPDCVEVEDFFGRKHDVTHMGIDNMLNGVLEDIARAQYDEEKDRGVVPTGMSFKEWKKVASPDVDISELADWNPEGKSN
jgi:hypothetical protein